MSFETAALILAWGAITLLAFAMAGMLRQLSLLAAALDGGVVVGSGPGIGDRLPAALLADNGNALPHAGHVLVFMDSDCPGCEALVPGLSSLGEDRQVTLIFRGSASESAPQTLRVLEGMALTFESLRVPATPFVILAASDGEILRAAPIGSPQALQPFLDYESERTAP